MGVILGGVQVSLDLCYNSASCGGMPVYRRGTPNTSMRNTAGWDSIVQAPVNTMWYMLYPMGQVFWDFHFERDNCFTGRTSHQARFSIAVLADKIRVPAW